MPKTDYDRRAIDGIKRALVFHQTLAFAPDDQCCACDRKWRSHNQHRSHLAGAIYLATHAPALPAAAATEGDTP